MGSLHVMNSKSCIQTLSHCNFIRYWSAVDFLWWSVKSTSELDYERACIFLCDLMVPTRALSSW